MKSVFAGKRVLVTGGLGFIGSALTRRLIALGARVRVLDALLPQRGGSPGSLAGLEANVELMMEDVRSRDSVNAAVRGCDLVYHLADHAENGGARVDWFSAIDTACLGTLNVLEAVRVHAASARLVFASSHLVYGPPTAVPVAESAPTEPTTLFGVHKLAGEKYCGMYHAAHRTDCVAARLATVYGPGQRLAGARSDSIAFVLDAALNDEPVELHRDPTFDAIYIGDAVDALLLLGDPATGNDPVNVASGVATSLRQVAALVTSNLSRGNFKWSDAGSRCSPFVADVSRLRSMGQAPGSSLEGGIARTIAWYTRSPDAGPTAA